MNLLNLRFALLLGIAMITTSLSLVLIMASPAKAKTVTPQTVVVTTSLTIVADDHGATAQAAPEFGSDPLQSPPDSSIVTTTRPIFRWTEPVSGTAISYTLRLTASTGAAEFTSTHTTYTPTQRFASGLYTWTVQAHNAAGEGSGYVQPVTFTIQAAPVFGPNPLQEPTSSAVLTRTQPTFAWMKPVSGETVSYTLRITGPAGVQNVASQSSTYTPTPGLPSGAYTWTVQAHNAAGETSGFIAPPLTFTVEAAPLFGANPLLTPANGSLLTEPWAAFSWTKPVSGEVTNYTLRLTGPDKTVDYTSVATSYTPALWSNGAYSWTVQANNSAGEGSGFASPVYTFTLDAIWQVYLPLINRSLVCPATSGNSYETISFLGPRADRPGPEHADLNLALRGYSETSAPKVLVQYDGATDANAPQLDGLFEPNAYPGISAVFRVNNWNWAPYPNPGTVGGPITDWPVTLMELPADPGTPLYIPERGPEIHGGGYKALVLYAEENRITLSYTRDDTVANGYAVHLENICVDPNLLALYRAQTDSEGWHDTGRLPALKNNQPLGTAFKDGVRVVIRDRGAFMDPRSGKDWWMGYATSLRIERSHDTPAKLPGKK